MKALLTETFLGVAIVAIGVAAADLDTGTVYECRQTSGVDTYAERPCEQASRPVVAKLAQAEKQDAAIDRIDREIAAVQSAIATKRIERKEAVTKAYDQEDASEEEIQAQADVIDQIYEQKIADLERELAMLGTRRNELVEDSTETILEAREL